jgi:hypothetical protein
VLLRKIIERDYNVDNGPRHLGGVKFRLTWDGMNLQDEQHGTCRYGELVSIRKLNGSSSFFDTAGEFIS